MGWSALGVAILVAALVVPGALTRLRRRREADAGRADAAREQFRYRREWLEARFLDAMGKADPAERLRWEDARWHDAVLWGRDRRTGCLLALIGVHFDRIGFEEPVEGSARRATVVFEYRGGRWRGDGKRLDEIHPHEAFLRMHRYEPVVVAPPPREG